MLYAFEDQLTTFVGAADTLVQFEEFIQATDSQSIDAHSTEARKVELASIMDMLSDGRLEGFQRPPVVIEHSSEVDRADFYKEFSIEAIKRNNVVNKHNEMLRNEYVDPFSALAESNQTIRELHNLDQVDPWDKRDEAEKAEDAEFKKAFEKGRKAGEISGDSFGGPPQAKKPAPKQKVKPGYRLLGEEDGKDVADVTDIHGHRDADNNVVLDRVIAVKGALSPEKSEKTDKPPETKSPDDEDLEIDRQGMVAIYHKVEVTGAKLEEIGKVLSDVGEDIEMAIVARNNSIGCWMAYLRQRQGEEICKILVDGGYDAESYAVNDAGERLVPKGVQVVTEEAEGEDHPRPWNSRAHELKKMNDEEKTANKKSIKPDEFIMTGAYEGAQYGAMIYITPKSYFIAHNKMWEEPLNIDHILPQDFHEVEPGVYNSKSRDWNNISFDLCSRGFVENWMLQLYLNSL